MVGVHVRAPRPRVNVRAPSPCARPSTVCALGCGRPCCCACPYCRARPTTVRAPRSRPTRRARPLFEPHETCVPPMHTYRSHSRPTPCALLQYKFIKIVVHSTTWASRPSTTVRWMTVGCLGGDHSFLIHFHRPRAHPRTRLYACLI
jgi:hypothetical protein